MRLHKYGLCVASLAVLATTQATPAKSSKATAGLDHAAHRLADETRPDSSNAASSQVHDHSNDISPPKSQLSSRPTSNDPSKPQQPQQTGKHKGKSNGNRHHLPGNTENQPPQPTSQTDDSTGGELYAAQVEFDGKIMRIQGGDQLSPQLQNSAGSNHSSHSNVQCGTPTFAISGPTKGPNVDVTTTSVCGSVPTGWTALPAPTGAGKSWVNAGDDASDCLHPTNPDSSCWDKLDIPGFVRWWWSVNQDYCKLQNLGFSDCFYDRSTPLAPARCGIIQAEPYCPKPDWSGFQPQWMPATHFYVAWTLYNVNLVFDDFYTALGSASTKSSEAIGKIVSLVDPIQQKNQETYLILTLVTSALYFVPSSELQIVNSLVTAMQQLASLSKLLYPTGTVDSQMETLGNVGADLEAVTNKYKHALVADLKEVESNSTAFIELVSGGGFSGYIKPLTGWDTAMTNGLLTYVVAEAFKSLGGYIGRAPQTDVHQLANNGTHLNWGVTCDNYDSNNMCGMYWYDSDNQVTYSLAGTPTKDDWSDPLHEIVHKLGYTTPELLFGNAVSCNGKPGNLTINDGKLQTPCLSTLQVCTWQKDIDIHHSLGPQLFADCPQSVAGTAKNAPTCNQDWLSNGATDVPESYLGGMLTMSGSVDRHDTCVINWDRGNEVTVPGPGYSGTPIRRRIGSWTRAKATAIHKWASSWQII